jgi:hypothetical protein
MNPHIWLIVMLTMWGGHPVPPHTAFLEGPLIAADCTVLKHEYEKRLDISMHGVRQVAAKVTCHYSLTRPVDTPTQVE